MLYVIIIVMIAVAGVDSDIVFGKYDNLINLLVILRGAFRKLRKRYCKTVTIYLCQILVYCRVSCLDPIHLILQ